MRPTGDAERPTDRADRGEDIVTKRGRVMVEKGNEIDRAEAADIVESWADDTDKGTVITVPGSLGAQVRGPDGRLPGLLRPLDGDRQRRPDRRRGRDHRRAVDR